MLTNTEVCVYMCVYIYMYIYIKMIKMTNFILWVFYHNFKKECLMYTLNSTFLKLWYVPVLPISGNDKFISSIAQARNLGIILVITSLFFICIKHLRDSHRWHWECSVSWTHLLLSDATVTTQVQTTITSCLVNYRFSTPLPWFFSSSSRPPCMFRPLHDFPGTRIK